MFFWVLMQFTDLQNEENQVATPPTPPADSGQGGAFGGQPYDPAKDTASSDDFVLDMDEIPDFSLDDVTETSSEPSVPEVSDPVPEMSSAPEVPAPAVEEAQVSTPVNEEGSDDITFDMDDLSMDLESQPQSESIEQWVGDNTTDTSDGISLDLDVLEESSSADVLSDDTVVSLLQEEENFDLDDLHVKEDHDDSVSDELNQSWESKLQPQSASVSADVDSDGVVNFDLGAIDNIEQSWQSETQEQEKQLVDTEESSKTHEDDVDAEDISFDLGELEDNSSEKTPVVEQSEELVQESAPAAQEDIAADFDLGDVSKSENTPDNAEADVTAAVVAPVVDEVLSDDNPVDGAIDTTDLSPLGAKVATTIATLQHIRALDEDDVRILGASHGHEEVYYEFSTADRELTILRDATDADDAKTQDRLTFTLGEQDLVVRLGDVVVLDEGSDDDTYTKHQHVVSEKLGKFEMLLDDYLTQAEEKKEQADAAAAQMKEAGRKLQQF